MRKLNNLLLASSALCICFITAEATARTAAYHPNNVTTNTNIGDKAVKTAPTSQSTDMWEKTKDVSSDVWNGTKEVTSDVWDGTKDVSRDIWDGAKKMGEDVSKAVSDKNSAPATMPAQ